MTFCPHSPMEIKWPAKALQGHHQGRTTELGEKIRGQELLMSGQVVEGGELNLGLTREISWSQIKPFLSVLVHSTWTEWNIQHWVLYKTKRSFWLTTLVA